MEIKKAEFVASNSDPGKCPNKGMPEFAFIGRSNVGKSSLINMLTGRKGLAMTSSTPGKTLTINHFIVNDGWFLVDLPGYGYAKRSKSVQEKIGKVIETYLVRRQELTCLFVLLDVRLEPQKIDVAFINRLGELGVPFALVFTKADKVSGGQAAQAVERYRQTLLQTWEELPEIFITSSEKVKGREALLAYIEKVMKS